MLRMPKMSCCWSPLPRPVFILASPRSGSTLLRVMLAGHAGLFSPPELNLLPFRTMMEREWCLGAAAYRAIDCDQRAGLVEAVMNLTGFDATGSEAWLRPWVESHVSILSMYWQLQLMAAPRRLVDKSTLNASSEEILARSRWVCQSSYYIHLIRHPCACIESLQRMYFAAAPAASSFREAEDLWAIPNANICRFLAQVQCHRKIAIRYEDLVAEPERVMRILAERLELEFEPAMVEPYSGARMTEGSPGRFLSVGDPNFRSHSGIDSQLGEKWRHVALPGTLSAPSQELAACYGYDLPATSFRAPAAAGATPAARQTVVLVIPPMSYRTGAYLRAAAKLGLRAICALDPAYGIDPEVEAHVPMCFDNPEYSAAELVSYARSVGTRAVVAIDDGGVEIAARAASTLGLPHNPVEAVDASNDKYAMRLLFQKAGVPSPRFERHWLCENPQEIAAKVHYPVVLKPIYLSGSRGVIRADTPSEFVSAFRRISRLLEQPGTGPDPKSLLVEEYIPGVEVSLEGVLTNGKIWPLGLYDKPDPLEGPFFEETILITPSRLPAKAQAQIVQCAAEALEAAGLTVGPFQVELRWNEQGPWVVEFAARTLGGHCSRALPFDGGLTLEELVLSHAAGLDTRRFVRAAGAHGVMMIPIPGEGVLRGVSGISEAEAVQGVSGVMITLPVGSMVTPLPEGDKYMGFIFAHAEHPQDVETALRQAHRHLSFEVDPITRVRLRICTTLIDN